MNRLHIAISLLLSLSTLAARADGGAGTMGSQGEKGSAGNSGHSGAIVMAVGCDDFLIKIAEVVHSQSSADAFINDSEFMCGDTSKVAGVTVKQIGLILTDKLANLKAHGFVPADLDFIVKSSSFDDLVADLQKFKTLFASMWAGSPKEYGCFPSQQMDNGNVQELKTCFSSELRSIESDGSVDLEMNITGFDLSPDAPFKDYPVIQERVDLADMPVLCPNKQPTFNVHNEFTSGKTAGVRDMHVTCDKLSVTNSVLYPSYEVQFGK